ncbi:hypothetical protein [Flavobacterium gilvum]|uniref:Uncharacterized protein n=1 Tax=Flavobacterium gilvum TaxID=1492737 RepID=A0AAC9I726_9FLAO|nr:hypothetical protein [Flavobacterium gilvum]AOW10491.1 hypothetical protein EM308_13815 [Flavobacterium gilvum]KFC61129.1 hypothetical protein FEM08_00650 [Flavobacterium gilvum]
MENNQPKTKDFELIDIDNRDENYSNEDIFYGLVWCLGGFNGGINFKDEKNFYDGEEVTVLQRIQCLCYIISYITDIDFLKQALSFLKMIGLIHEKDIDLEKYLISAYSQGFYSETDTVKIMAIFYSLTSRHNLNSKTLRFPKSEAPKALEIKIKNRVIEHNLTEVESSIRRNNLLQFEDVISKESIIEQKKSIDKWLRALLKFTLFKNTNFLDLEINYLEKISNHLIEPEKLNNDSDQTFSIMEWATIFYYADETESLSDGKTKKERMNSFLEDNNINTTVKSFKNKYHIATKRINNVNDYPIKKLKLIIPFMKSKYSKSITKIENDIDFLTNELSD